MARAIKYSRNVRSKNEKELIDAIFEVSALANKNIVEELKMGDEDMCQALMEIMKPEIDEAVNKAVDTAVNAAVLKERRETTERAIKAAVKSLRRFNTSDLNIKMTLMEDYNLSEEEALSYLK